MTSYLDQGWGFVGMGSYVSDSRVRPQLSSRAVFLSVFLMFSLRLRSLNSLEEHLRIPRCFEAWVGKAKPSADTIGYSLSRFNLERLRDLLAGVAHRAKRKKALRRRGHTYYWVAALDGHELFSSFKRCCDQCLRREIKTGRGVEIQYYHRVVVLQLVDVSVPLLLDIEPVLAGEDEVAAATRIVGRLRARYPRFVDIITCDALYLGAPFIEAAKKEGLHLVVVLKDDRRDLYQDVEGLLRVTPPKATIVDEQGRIERWDFEGLLGWSQMKSPVRVVRSLEQLRKRERVGGQWKETIQTHDWRWFTTLPSHLAGADLISRWGHARWDIENRGFNELQEHWAMDHCFRHHHVAIMAFLLILALAFALTTFFFVRNLKPPLRRNRTRLFLASLLLSNLPLDILASCRARSP